MYMPVPTTFNVVKDKIYKYNGDLWGFDEIYNSSGKLICNTFFTLPDATQIEYSTNSLEDAIKYCNTQQNRI